MFARFVGKYYPSPWERHSLSKHNETDTTADDPGNVTVNDELPFELRRQCGTMKVSGGKAA